MWIDVDSTVNEVYGNQEGVAAVYNPRKKGQKSYHLLMTFIFIKETQEVFCLFPSERF